MTPRVTAVRIHTADDVKGMIDEALKIVAALEVDGDLKLAAFEKAVDLLAVRVTIGEQPQSIPLGIDLRSRPGGH